MMMITKTSFQFIFVCLAIYDACMIGHKFQGWLESQ